MQDTSDNRPRPDEQRTPPDPCPVVCRVAGTSKVLFAREQRQIPTRVEDRVWEGLRRRGVGYKFRRQHPIGDFVLDFFCSEVRLAVEIDGDCHQEQAVYDQWRDEQLNRVDIEVLRIPEEQARANLSRTVNLIKIACEEQARRRAARGLTPSPSPSRERGTRSASSDG